jgi:ferrous iron transport protein B
MRILLTGNPNVGKSAIFSQLTGISVTTSNYPGTTVQYTKGYMTYDNIRHEIIDVPGTYRLDPDTEAEKVAVDMIKSGDILVNVVDTTNLERNLDLSLQLMEYGKPIVIALNMWDDAKHKGIAVDAEKLSKLLNIPVVQTNGLTGEGLKELQKECVKAKVPVKPDLTKEQRWEKIGRITSIVQNLSYRHHTFIERLQNITIHPIVGFPIAILTLYLIFRIIILVGEFLVEHILKVFEIVYVPVILWISGIIGRDSILHSILIGEIEGRTIDFEGAMGVLTTGVFVTFGIVLPYIILFYIVFGFLEDLGYLPRVAIIFDRVLHRIGLHGYSVIPMMLAFGCNVPGILAVRNLETRRERFITAVITCITIPCMAQTALIIRAAGKQGGIYLALVFSTLATVWAVLGMFLKWNVRGNTPTLLMEVPPYRLPSVKIQLKKLRMRVVCFFKEAIPYVFGGIFIINVLHVAGVIKFLGRIFSPVIKGVFGLPEETVSALIIGILRKDAAIALLEPLELDSRQMIVSVLILILYFPCVATFTVLFKELGLRDTFKAVLVMFITTFITGAFINLMLGKIYDPASLIVVEIMIIFICAMVVPQTSHGKSQ